MSAAKVTGKTELVAVRFDHALVARIDALAEELSRPGLKLTRSDAFRVAVETGLDALEAAKSKSKK